METLHELHGRMAVFARKNGIRRRPVKFDQKKARANRQAVTDQKARMQATMDKMLPGDLFALRMYRRGCAVHRLNLTQGDTEDVAALLEKKLARWDGDHLRLTVPGSSRASLVGKRLKRAQG